MAKKSPPKPPATPPAGNEKLKADRASEKFVSMWENRIRRESKRYKKWAQEFDVELIEKYVLGHQWRGLPQTEATRKYVINITQATMEAQLPSMLFGNPKVKVEPKPPHGQAMSEDAADRASLIQDTLQTFIDDEDVDFVDETSLALRDGYSRFAVVEVGYTADWIDNPNAGKPLLKDDEKTPQTNPDTGEALTEPKRVPKGGTEMIYVRRLDPDGFRVSPGRPRLEANDWVAYPEYLPLNDVKTNPEYQNTQDLKGTAKLSDSDEESQQMLDDDYEKGSLTEQVKIWKVWDLRGKVRHVFAEGHKKPLQQDKAFTYLPIAVLKFIERKNAFYPTPPVYNWLGPQDELNETREMQRVHRKRFLRRFMREPQVKPEEWTKLEAGEDGVCIEVPKVDPPPIAPIQDAELGSQNWTHLANTREDFMEISGVSGEARGVPQADTATQANIINVRAQLRESAARTKVARWLAKIARLMLFCIREKMQLPVQVKRATDTQGLARDLATTGQVDPNIGRTIATWQSIDSEDLEDLDVDIKIQISSLSPVAQEAERANWLQVLTLLTNPQVVMLLMTPDPIRPDEPTAILRKTLSLYNITSEREVREIWRIGMEVLKQMAIMAMVKAGGAGAGAPMGPGVPGMPGAGAGAPTGTPADMGANAGGALM